MIKMVGIDYSTASLDIRSKCSLRKAELFDVMDRLKTASEAEGIIILSTCNRVEIWISGGCDDKELVQLFCKEKNIELEDYRSYFVRRTEEEAKTHLFFLACGLKSAILAEDQILSQVREAMDYSRENGFSDPCLQMLFKCAVTTAKKVKTNVKFQYANNLAIEQAIQTLKAQGYDINGKRCLVIGNGVYGKLSANALVREGGKVMVTIRQYHSGEVLIPENCDVILYGDKYKAIPECHLIVSATASPNFTLYYEDILKCQRKNDLIIIDLAVPRDVDPEIGNIPGIKLYDIDDFRSDEKDINEDARLMAQAYISQGIKEFDSWIGFRAYVPKIEEIREESTSDILARLTKPFKKLEISEMEKDIFKSQIESASGKVIANLFYQLKKSLSEEEFKKVLDSLE